MSYGKIHLILRDSSTEEIIEEVKKDNVLTTWFFDKIAQHFQFAPRIAVTDAEMERSVFTRSLPSDQLALYPTSVIPAVGFYVKHFPAAGATPAFLEFSGRYSAPALGTSRTIRSVALCGRYTNTGSPTTGDGDNSAISKTASFFSADSLFAFAKLSEPCIQGDTQVLDIFYRVFFPYDASAGISEELHEESVKSRIDPNLQNNYPLRAAISTFKFPTVKSYDAGQYDVVSFKGAKTLSPFTGKIFPVDSSLSTDNNNLNFLIRQLSYTDAQFTDRPGQMFGALIFSNPNIIVDGWPISTQLSAAAPISTTNLTAFSKIQNIIAQGSESTAETSTPWLDVDNLPTGNGQIAIGGSWNHIDEPTAPGLYYSAKMPELIRIKISESGAAGTAKYDVIRQKFLGLRQFGDQPNRYTPHAIIPLCGEDFTPTLNVQTPYSGKTLIGDVSDTAFGVKQISAAERFDDSSFIIAKKNEIILYNLAASDYWRYTGDYTDIHQVAVANDKIYVACRNTGLYVIDPRNSLVSAKISNTAGIDFSACYGVARGFNSTIWAVAANGLAKLEDGSWVRYDEASTPAFNLPGISDAKWDNVEFLKVDELSATHQMLLVRREAATDDASSLGVWWSTTTAAVNAGAEAKSTTSQLGWPRRNRRHVGGLGGLWAVITANAFWIMSFGTADFTVTPITADVLGFQNERLFQIFQAVNFKRDDQNNVRLLTLHESINRFSNNGVIPEFFGTNLFTWQPTIKLLDQAASITNTSVSHGLTIHGADVGGGSNNSFEQLTDFASNVQSSAGAFRDKSTYFELCHGLIISCSAVQGVASAAPNGVITQAMCYGASATPEGGAMKWLCQESYGWTGSDWEIGAPSRTVHTTAEPLFDGLTLAFEAGKTYNAPNVYKFGLYDGLLKDNATRATYNSISAYHGKTVKDATDVEFSIIPNPAAGEIGVIGIDQFNASNGVILDEFEQVNIPGQNVRCFAMGSKDLVGDFDIVIDASRFASDIKMRRTAAFGISRGVMFNRGFIDAGFWWNDGTLYIYEQGNIFEGVSLTELESLGIRRVSGTVTLLRNSVVVRTISNPAAALLLQGTALRLNMIFSNGADDAFRNATYYNPDSLVVCPKTTIISNGTDIAVRLGNPITRTGAYADGLYQFDILSGTLEIKIDGVNATLKYDGTAPAAGEVSFDHLRGIAYFNAADAGKSLTAKYTYLQTK